MRSSIHGFPRIGAERELKFAVEAYWSGKSDGKELAERAGKLRAANYEFLKASGLDLIPVGDFSLYDKVLDTICMSGAVPKRFPFAGGPIGPDQYFAMARGLKAARGNVRPLSMLKWFNTNYHYLVPEFIAGMKFSFSDRTLLDLVDEALGLGLPAMPVLVGPVSFLLLGRGEEGLDPLALLKGLLPVWEKVVGELAARGVEWIQIDEPCFAAAQSDPARRALKKAYAALAAKKGKARIVLQTYFDHVGPNYETLAGLPVDGLGLDFVHGPENLDLIEKHGWPKEKTLFAGVVDGRNIWACNPDRALSAIGRLAGLVGKEKLIVSSSCSLMHVPVSLEGEDELPGEVLGAMAFAREKVAEVVALAHAAEGVATAKDEKVLERARRAVETSGRSSLKTVPQLRRRLEKLTEKDYRRGVPFSERIRRQNDRLRLPLFPTTTIGSFPQTAEVRRLRARLRKGELTEEQYRDQIRKNIQELVKLQEDYDIDVLVHGEFERNDMVEYFGEQLDGYYFTRIGWVISYGSRGVKPPVIYGDVVRRGPMTVEWSKYAQSLTRRPMKGMLTGPVTMLNWSFVRDDIPRRDVCRQLALAIRDEVADLEQAGIGVIQIDEPALREGLPLEPEKQTEYLRWAVEAFRLASSGAGASTQIHSHMCYSDFNTIFDQIVAMDADVISIENSRAGGRLLQVFRDRKYPNCIGPGVWDIHSPLVPGEDEISKHLRDILRYLPTESVWVNPDCGLKTRGWEEVHASLRNMVSAAQRIRREYT
ncbi:MAG: 5-methyltetrahydropteroyltriglutamate--homocysteine S-methyltransferase [Candidatus Glassbacteria bacterium]